MKVFIWELLFIKRYCRVGTSKRPVFIPPFFLTQKYDCNKGKGGDAVMRDSVPVSGDPPELPTFSCHSKHSQVEMTRRREDTAAPECLSSVTETCRGHKRGPHQKYFNSNLKVNKYIVVCIELSYFWLHCIFLISISVLAGIGGDNNNNNNNISYIFQGNIYFCSCYIWKNNYCKCLAIRFFIFVVFFFCNRTSEHIFFSLIFFVIDAEEPFAVDAFASPILSFFIFDDVPSWLLSHPFYVNMFRRFLFY